MHRVIISTYVFFDSVGSYTGLYYSTVGNYTGLYWLILTNLHKGTTLKAKLADEVQNENGESSAWSIYILGLIRRFLSN